MRKSVSLLLAFALCFCLCSCASATVTFDPGEPLSYEVFDEIPQDRDVIVLNKSSLKIHKSTCRYAASLKEENRLITEAAASDHYISIGYTKCKICFR